MTSAATPKKEAKRVKTGNLVPCPGEAHAQEVGGMIDNCMYCAPRWGQVEELAPVDMAQARADRLDLRINDLTESQREEVDALEKAGVVNVQMVSTKSASYFVARWV